MNKINDHERFGKYPDVYVWGKSVTSSQAEDIIRRTDYTIFEYVGSSYDDQSHRGKWLRWLHEVLGLSIRSPLIYMDETDKFRMIHGKEGLLNHVKSGIGYIPLVYLSNTWADSSIPSGWCDPSGSIYMNSSVKCKWPTDGKMFKEWKLIAKAFPFLDLTCSIIGDGRGTDGEPKDYPDSISYRVKDGKVRRRKFINPPVIYQTGILDRLLSTFHDLKIPGDGKYLEPHRSIMNGLPAAFFIRTGLMTRPLAEEWMQKNGIVSPDPNRIPDNWKKLEKWDEENGVFWTLE